MNDPPEEIPALAKAAARQPDPITMAQFFESTPPSRSVKVANVARKVTTRVPGSGSYRALYTPQLRLYCTSRECNGFRFFRASGEERLSPHETSFEFFLLYICSNCRSYTKKFAFSVTLDSLDFDSTSGSCYKYGEAPPYGPPTPSRVIEMSGDDRDIFLKGRRCETQGLGIGAFAYYRRAVENQKNTILDEIIRVSTKIGASAPMIEALEAAKRETQFSKALSSVKEAIPQSLLINGHNPLTLLHRALSGGVHERTDEECLDHDVRVVLTELADRLGQALKDEAELNTAVSRLMNPRKQQASDPE
jgi:hypothetical protein